MKKKTLYYGQITAGTGLLLGGVKTHTSSSFQKRQDVENWLDQVEKANQEANRNVFSSTIMVCYKSTKTGKWVKREEK